MEEEVVLSENPNLIRMQKYLNYQIPGALLFIVPYVGSIFPFY